MRSQTATHTAQKPTPIARLAHRGLTTVAAENTLAAFADALAAGAQWLEIDVNTTVDGVPIVFHDPFLDRLTSRSGLVRNVPWKEIQQLKLEGGYSIPSLAEVLETFPDAQFNIDMKDAASAVTVPRELERLNQLPRVRITSFIEKNRRVAYRSLKGYGLENKVTLGASELSMVALYAASFIHPKMWSVIAAVTRGQVAPIDAVQIPLTYRLWGRTWKVLTPRLLKTAHAQGYEVHIWTIDDPQQMRELIDAGVDGIVTNRADILSQVLEEIGR